MANRQVKIFINGKEVEGQIKAIAAAKRKLVNELNLLVEGTEDYEKKEAALVTELQKANKVLDDHRKKIRSTGDAVDNTGSAFDKLIKGGVTKFAAIAASAFAVQEIVMYGKELFDLSAKMEVLQAKARTVFGEALPQVTRAAEENATAMGLTVGQYTAAAAAIGDLLIPMKFNREEAAAMSTNLVDLSGALSEWTGGQITSAEVSRTLSKALLGEREELKTLGISILEADVTARLAEKGMSKLTGTLLQQAKATATLELITEKSVDAQTAFANNADTAVRRQAELSAKISEVSEKLATALIPIFSRLLSVAEGLADGILAITDGITSLINPAQSATDAFNEQQVAFDDLNSTLPDLLTRYEELTKKTNLSEAEQQDLKKVIGEIGEIVPTAITSFDDYGRALGISTEKAREFIEAQQLLLQQRNREAIDENTTALEKYQKRLESINAALSERNDDGDIVRTIATFSKTDQVQLNNIKLTADEIRNLQKDAAELEKQIRTTDNAINLLKGIDITGGTTKKKEDTNPPPPLSPTPDEIAEQAKAAEKLAKQRAAQAERERKEREKQLERLQEIVNKYQEDARISLLSEDEQKIERLRQQYDKEIAIALELEAKGVKAATEQRLELERLKEEAVSQLRFDLEGERLQKQYEDQQKQYEEDQARIIAFEEQKAELQKQIDEEARAEILSAQELAIVQLTEHYDELRALAELYGIDTLAIDVAQRNAEAAIADEFNKKELKRTEDINKAKLQSMQALYQGIGELIQSSFDLIASEGSKQIGFQKLATIAQIAIDTASAISSLTAASEANPGNILTGGIAGIIQFTTGLARILGNIAKAKELIANVGVPQRATGGWLTARGQDDGINYQAKYIGTPETGMLPNHPVLFNSRSTGGPVLASERGSEYFVSAASLRNPAVLNYVRAIDNIQKYRQFAGGGFTNTAGVVSSTGDAGSAQTTEAVMQLTNVITLLVNRLNNPLYAVIDDDTAIDLRDRINKLVNASGGVL